MEVSGLTIMVIWDLTRKSTGHPQVLYRIQLIIRNFETVKCIYMP